MMNVEVAIFGVLMGLLWGFWRFVTKAVSRLFTIRDDQSTEIMGYVTLSFVCAVIYGITGGFVGLLIDGMIAYAVTVVIGGLLIEFMARKRS